MKRVRTAIITAGMAAVLGGCSQVTSLLDETVATEPLETEEYTEAGPQLEPSETIEAFPETAQEEDLWETEGDGLRLIVATDIHYLAEDLTDKGSGFTYAVEHGDGKVTNYIWEITDAFIAEVLNERPDGVILSGDLSLDGEKASHQELVERLRTITDAGIPVLVIPGNHDINNVSAAQFSEGERLPAETTSPEDFLEIYQDFGYRDAISRDPNSLSYVYEMNDYTRIMMLDTCQYEGTAQIGGMIDTDTYEWIEEQLMDASEKGMNVLPVAHHNMLEESQIYASNCTIEHNEELIDLLEGWGTISLFLSGHLHVQHFANTDDVTEEGIWEIVTSSLATPPCQYGVLFYGDDQSFSYHTQVLDIDTWARVNGIQDENLLKFSEYRTPFLENVFYNQAFDLLEKHKGGVMPDGVQEEMSQMYAIANCYYYWGRAVEIAEQMKESSTFRLWQEYGYPSLQTEYLEYILDEATRDYNTLRSGESME